MKAAALQTAIYNQLNDVSLTGLLSSAYAGVAIFSDVPDAPDAEDDDKFPYVVIGKDTISPYNTKGSLGGNAVCQIDVYGRSTSKLATKAVADAIDARLNRQSLTIAGVTHITTELESSDLTPDPDGRTCRILSIYRVLYLA